MSTKEKAISYCKQQLEQLQLLHIFDLHEFNRQFKGCSLLNPFSVGLQIADNLIFYHHYKITKQNEQR